MCTCQGTCIRNVDEFDGNKDELAYTLIKIVKITVVAKVMNMNI